MPLRAARCARDLRAALQAGITSVREVGGLGVHLARAVAEGVLEGPAIYAAGAILSVTGGHADLHSYPLPWIGDFGVHYGELRLADGPAECMRAVREQLRQNARVIKVCASGGVMSEIDDPIHQQFTIGELRAIVEVAGLAERVVAALCHGKPGIMAAVEAGVRTIEHGTYLDDEACDAMREMGVILVPTRAIIEDILANLAAVPDYAAAKLTALAGRHAESVSRAIDRGVTIAMGTDISVTGPGRPNSWGTNGARACPPGTARDDAAAGDRGGDRYRPADARPAGTQVQQAGTRIRRRYHHPRREPARRHRGARPPRSRSPGSGRMAGARHISTATGNVCLVE